MKAKATLFTLCALLTACAAQPPSPMEIKPGLWEERIVKMEWDGEDVKDWLRARVCGGQTPSGQCQQIDDLPKFEPVLVCVSAAMIAREYWLNPFVEEDMNCTPPKVSRQGQRATSERTCKFKLEDQDKQQTLAEMAAKTEVVIANETSVKVKMMVTTAFEKGTYQYQVANANEYQMKFLDSDCGDVQPEDGNWQEPKPPEQDQAGQ
jgi:hypothetical protein